MKFLRAAPLALLTILLACAGAAEQTAPDSTAERKVIDVKRADRFATARLRVDAVQLRELVCRLLDEDGYRMERMSGPVTAAGQTLRGKKHLRHVECEILPGADPETATLGFEYTRFGNRAWAEHELDRVIEYYGKFDPAPETPAKPLEHEFVPTKGPVIDGTDYFTSNVLEIDHSLPIEPLSLDAPGRSGGDTPEVAQCTAVKTEPESGAAPTRNGAGAEVVALPGQKLEVSQPRGSEELFRQIQRGEIAESAAKEKISVYLQILWLDAHDAPADEVRDGFAGQLSAALSGRLIGSKLAAQIVGTLDVDLRDSGRGASTHAAAIQDLESRLKDTDADEPARAKLLKAAQALLE